MARKEVSKMVFDSMDQFSTWFEEEGHEMNDENVVTIVKDNDWIRIDIDTHCVRPSTAVRRMFAQLKDIPEVEGWEEVMLEHIKTVESDWCWKSNDATMADGTTNKYQTFAYSIEDLDSDHWYVFLNVRTAESMKRIEAEQLAWWEADRADEIETAVAEEVQKEMDEERMEKEMEKKEALLLITRAKNSILTTEDRRSAWKRGVLVYAGELLDELTEAVQGGYVDRSDLESVKCLKRALLNGADDWNQYSWGGCSLIYGGDIAERLCTPSELKKTRNGELRPNGSEEWLDVQARALHQAGRMVWVHISAEVTRMGWDKAKGWTVA